MPFLSDAEVCQLTKKMRRSAQVRALRFMGVEHRIRSDGTVLISRSHIEKILDGDSSSVRFLDEREPNWEAMRAKKKKL